MPRFILKEKLTGFTSRFGDAGKERGGKDGAKILDLSK